MKSYSIFLALLLHVQVSLANTTLIDVRTSSEFSEKHHTNAINIDVQNDDFKKKISELDKNKSYQVYCRSGRRSGKAAEIMKSLGFKNVENLGGFDEAGEKIKKLDPATSQNETNKGHSR